MRNGPLLRAWTSALSAIGALLYCVSSLAQVPIFTDVAYNDSSRPAIEAIYRAGITSGCAGPPLQYCPGTAITRAQMATFLGRTVHGALFVPNAGGALSPFADVPNTYLLKDWVIQSYSDGFVTPCSTTPLNFCPDVVLTREQAAQWLLLAKNGPSYVPPAATGIFSDVPLSDPLAPWVEALYNLGYSKGCSTGPLSYCPAGAITRASMALLLTRIFDMPPSIYIRRATTLSSGSLAVQLEAVAFDFDNAITSVEFFAGATSICLLPNPATPATCNWTAPASGTYVFTAKATDATGSVRTSAAASVHVLSSPSTIALTSPTGVSAQIYPATIALAATASDPVGIASVDFLIGNDSFPATVSAPYTASISNVPPGSYSIRARVTNTAGQMAITTAALVTVATASQSTYAYDAAGRLTGVSQGPDAAQYTYDAAGNILRIDRLVTTTPTIFSFEPISGAIGSTVLIHGIALSSGVAPTVKFNGVAATVGSFSATDVSVTVPVSATSGLVSITNAAGTANSSVAFTVLPPPATAPVVTSFLPTSGTPPNSLFPTPISVNVTGSNFATAASGETVRIGEMIAPISAAPAPTSTSVTVTLPANTNSGHISVQTPAGIGISAAVFATPPPGHVLTDIQTSNLIVINGAPVIQSVANGASGTLVGVLYFDGTIGQLLGLGFSSYSSTGGNTAIKIYRPDGQLLTSNYYVAPTMALPALPMSGTYSIVMAPPASVTTTATFTLSSALTISTTPDAAAVTIPTSTRIGQPVRLTFLGVQGLGYGFLITGMTSGSVATTTLTQPGGTPKSATVSAPGNSLAFPVSPGTGTNTLVLEPATAAALAGTIRVLNDHVGAIQFKGTAQTVTIDTAGRSTVLPFTTTSALFFDSYTTSTKIGNVLIYDVNGNVANFTTKWPAGTYYMVVPPASTTATGTGTVVLGDVDLSVNSTITLNPFDVSAANTSSGCAFTFTVTYKIKNQGLVALRSGITWDAYIYDSSDGIRHDLLLRWDAWSGTIAPNSSVTSPAYSVSVPDSAATRNSTRNIIVTIDDNQQLPENNRSNNQNSTNQVYEGDTKCGTLGGH